MCMGNEHESLRVSAMFKCSKVFVLFRIVHFVSFRGSSFLPAKNKFHETTGNTWNCVPSLDDNEATSLSYPGGRPGVGTAPESSGGPPPM
jgi:hypothetical protein